MSINNNQTMRRIFKGYLFFLVKDRNLFHQVDTISNIFTSGAVTSETITDGVHEMKKSFIQIQYSSFPLFPVGTPSA